MLIKLKNCRGSYLEVFTARTFQSEGDACYSGSFLFPKTDKANLLEIEAALKAVAREQWKDKADAVLKELKAKDKTCLHDGDAKSSDGYEGHYFVSARRKEKDRAPLVIDRDKSPLTSKDGKPYSGCYVNVNLDIWPQDNGFGKRINATLVGVQFVKDGEAFSGAVQPDADEFDSVEDDAEGLV